MGAGVKAIGDELLTGITVIDLSTSCAGAKATMFFADAGADVILIEPPEGSALRGRVDWPALGRGKQSLVLDLSRRDQRASLLKMLESADVLVTTPGFGGQEVGMSADELKELNPRLVSAAITAWGPAGPWADLASDEASVMAKLGYCHIKSRLVARPGPAYVSIPYASWGAAHTAVHGILAALFEREASGFGQHVEADFVRGVNTIDTWAWYTELVGLRWPGAYEITEAFNDAGEILGHLIYPLLLALTKDGHWVQFAQVQPKLFAAMMQEFGLSAMLAEPKWRDFPYLPTQELRTEFWELLLTRVQERSLAEWHAVFESNADILAEPLRRGSDVLNHPQLVHDGRVATVTDPDHGPVRQPSTLVHMDGRPTTVLAPAPRLGEHRALPGRPVAGAESSPPKGRLPLEGVTVLELGVMYAAPFGPTLLADLGARVIKVEPLEGDAIRMLMPFPEVAGAKVMQGKESIALDLNTEEGLRLVHELAARSDIVMQGFRAGAATRCGVDAKTLQAINPDLIYVNAPGYGIDGPYGHRPAYAPSIGAAAGLTLGDFPAADQTFPDLEKIKRAAAQLNTASAIPALQADGIAALGVASTMLLGLLAKARGRHVGELTATMISTAAIANLENVIDYPDRPPARRVDPDGYGLNARYRIYRAADGWIFLAARSERDTAVLLEVLGADDPGFAGAWASDELHSENGDRAFAAALGTLFATRSARDWERELSAKNVGCVQLHEGAPQKLLQVDPSAAAEYAAVVTGPIFDEHPRPGAAVRFSRSRSCAESFCLCGEDTDDILLELGYDLEQIAELRSARRIG